MNTRRFYGLVLVIGLLMLSAGCKANTDNPTPVPDTTTTAPTTTATAAVALTAEEAQAIALSHAGLTAEKVSQLHIEYESDNGIPKYEVSFRNGDYEYDYDIHAQSGAVISHDKDIDRDATSPVP